MELAPGTLVGDYQLVGPLGRGATGTVYAAIHPVIGRRAAVKVLHRHLCRGALVERFLREARAANRIRHPGIVDVLAFGILGDGRAYLVMEHLEGESLRGRLRGDGLSIGEATSVLHQLAEALEAVHAAGVVHRDVKPDNVVLVARADGRVRATLLDFGLAAVEGESQRLTRVGTILGTPRYLSPEQARSRRAGPKSDVYSLGVVAYEVLTGSAPFHAGDATSMLFQHLTALPRPLRERAPGLPAGLEALVLSMLNKDPERRPTAAQVRAALERAPPEAGPDRRWRAAVLGMIAGLLLSAVVVPLLDRYLSRP